MAGRATRSRAKENPKKNPTRTIFDMDKSAPLENE
jgi:hypothetical protein